jgi:glycosyltransferase involved in cell wall biosynthesis
VARGLFVEPFYGGSHRAFLDGLAAHGGHELALLTLPEGEWRRRMRRGAQELAGRAGEAEDSFDFLVVSDMLDLPVFLALTRPRFERVPVMAYFHENQFTYPRLRGTKFNSWFGQVNYLSALAADVVGFNSAFHRDDFLGALRTLAGQPNNWLLPGAIEEIAAKSVVLPVGVELDWLKQLERKRDETGPRTILWNHRWEFDKAPELFARVVCALASEGVPFRVAIAGEEGDNPSEAMWQARDVLGERVVHFGFAGSREAYGKLLWESDIVISTTRHEFFGVGMVEAMAAGCVPIAPRRYNYPVLVPGELHDRLLFEGEADLRTKLRDLLTRPLPPREMLQGPAARFGWDVVGPQWHRALAELARGRHGARG